jgi:polysaccharide pyruvyl transferase CsaB
LKPNSDVAATLCADALGGARNVLLIGGYGCGNLGDEAILSVLAGEWRDERHVRVVTANAVQTRALHGLDAVPAAPQHLLPALRRADAVVIGGGGIFSGYMGKRSMSLPLLALMALGAHKRVVFRALGAYRSTPRPIARALVSAMERAHFVSVRDRASLDALEAFGLRRHAILEPDPALRLQPRPHGVALPGRAVGFALRRVRDAGLQVRVQSDLIAQINAVTGTGTNALLLPFSRHPTVPLEDDFDYAMELRAGSELPSSVSVVDTALHPTQMLDIIASLERLVAMRFHAAVFGHIAGVPTDIIAYDDKCASFAEERGLAYRTLGQGLHHPLELRAA